MDGLFSGLAGIAMLLWYASAIYIGVRLLRVGMRETQRPALLVGTYLLVSMGFGGIGMSIPMMRAMEGAAITGADRAIFAIGCLLSLAGISAILTFTREVFRRESAWATWLFVAIGLIMVSGLAGHGITTGFSSKMDGGWFLTFLIGTILANGWTSTESLIYYRMMRKRSKVGLAEPLVANRFLLWGIGAGSSTSLLVLSLAQQWAQIATGPNTAEAVRTGGTPLVALLGLSCAFCYLFAFTPARWYARWIEGKSAEAN